MQWFVCILLSIQLALHRRSTILNIPFAKNVYMSHTKFMRRKMKHARKRLEYINWDNALAYIGLVWFSSYLNAIKWHNCKMPESMYRIWKGSQSCQRQSFNILTPLTTQRSHSHWHCHRGWKCIRGRPVSLHAKPASMHKFLFSIPKNCENNEELLALAPHMSWDMQFMQSHYHFKHSFRALKSATVQQLLIMTHYTSRTFLSLHFTVTCLVSTFCILSASAYQNLITGSSDLNTNLVLLARLFAQPEENSALELQ